MAATQADIDAIRDEIGTDEPPTDAELFELYDSMGSSTAVVYKVLKRRLANLLAGPAQYSISGTYSENNTATIEALRVKMAALEGTLGIEADGSELRMVTAVRPDVRGR